MDQQDDVQTVTLKRPIIVGAGDKGKTYETLTLREPTAGELGKVSREETSVAGLTQMITLVAGIPRDVARMLCSRDLDQCDEILSSFKIPEGEEPMVDEDQLDEYTITLRKPVTVANVRETTLTLTEPSGKDKERAAKAATETLAAIDLISAVAKVPRVVVERLCQRDFEEACYFLASCRLVGRPTGRT